MKNLFLRASACLAVMFLCAGARAEAPFTWRTDALPKLPQPIMNHAMGVSNGALVIAGGRTVDATGQNQPALDTIYVLTPGATEWRMLGKLPTTLMAMACAYDETGIYLAGGFDGKADSAEVYRLRYERGQVSVERLAQRLPIAMSSNGAVIYNHVFYTTGGLAKYEGDLNTVGVLLSLDLRDPKATWQTTNRVPGLERVGSIVVPAKDGLYVLGGLPWGTSIGKTGIPSIDDCYHYAPGMGWSSMPIPPTDFRNVPALTYGPSALLLLGNGGPSLPKETVLSFDLITQTWAQMGALPDTRANAPAVTWNGMIVIAGGNYVTADKKLVFEDSVLTGTPRARANGFGVVDYLVVAGYFAAMIGMGVYFSRRERSTEAFFLGGRTVPWWAVGISIFGASVSSITYLTFPAKAYATDWIYLAANLSFLFIVPFIAWFYIPGFRKGAYTTAYEYLEHRFNLCVRIYGSLVFVLFQLGRIAIVMYLPALVISAACGLSMTASITAMGVVTTLYTVLGGVEAVIWTDVVQAVVLIGGALIALLVALANIDGGAHGLATMAEAAGKTHWFVFSDDYTSTSFWVVIVGNAFLMLYPHTACQTVVQRYFTTATDREARRAVWTNAIVTVPVTIMFFALGTALWGYFKGHPEKLDPTLPTDAILPVFVLETFPVGLRSTLLAGVFAAAMSALGASMNSLAAVAVYDYYKRFVPTLSDARALWTARAVTLAVGVAGTFSALGIAWAGAPTSMLDRWFQWLGLIGGGLSGIVALGVFTKRAHGRGAVVGAIASAVAVAWVHGTRVHFFLHAAVGFLVAYVVGYVASLIIPRKSEASTHK